MSKTVQWRYRTAIGGPLSEPVTVTLADDEHARLTALTARMRSLPEGEARTALLNEITTIMDMHALFPDAGMTLYPTGGE